VIVATLIFLRLDLPVVLVDSALLSLALFAAVIVVLASVARGK
jgi:hypothetical protein